jgi:hypothetical protein
MPQTGDLNVGFPIHNPTPEKEARISIIGVAEVVER